MPTPLTAPHTFNITVETKEELLGLILRFNLDNHNLAHWYHDVRGKTQRVVPDTRFGEMYSALKAVADREGINWDDPSTVEGRTATEPTQREAVEIDITPDG